MQKNTKRKCIILVFFISSSKYYPLMLDSVIRVSKKYYPQTLLDECKYEIKKTRMENLVH